MKPTVHVFIDTNVFLNFFAYTGDDIDQLKTLVGSIESGAMKLYLPQQVVDEFSRNRERTIKESIETFASTKLAKGLPRLLLDYPSVAEFQDGINAAESARDGLLEAVRKDARTQSLAADKLFQSLKTASGVLSPTPELLARARDRKALGNPPGKSDSLGDQLNWETLLEEVEDGVDLHIVSKDGDYRSALFNTQAHQFLVDEWASRKAGSLTLHPEIKPLLKAWFPAIKLKIDKEKASALEELESAGSYAATHQAVERLLPFVDLLTIPDIVRLAQAALQNTQIRWIAGDDDVNALFRKVLPAAFLEFSSEQRAELEKLFELPGQNQNLWIPF